MVLAFGFAIFSSVSSGSTCTRAHFVVGSFSSLWPTRKSLSLDFVTLSHIASSSNFIVGSSVSGSFLPFVIRFLVVFCSLLRPAAMQALCCCCPFPVRVFLVLFPFLNDFYGVLHLWIGGGGFLRV
jgi:hypothetical protein